MCPVDTVQKFCCGLAVIHSFDLSSAQRFCAMNGPVTARPAALSKVDASTFARSALKKRKWHFGCRNKKRRLDCIALDCIDQHTVHCMCTVHCGMKKRVRLKNRRHYASVSWCLYTSFKSQAEFLCSVQSSGPLS